MNAIHIIMATSVSANPHNPANEHIGTVARKRKISAFTFLVFGILLIVAGFLLASFESQRFAVSFIVFGIIGIIFAFIYWISAERLLITLRKLNAERMRQARILAQTPDVTPRDWNVHHRAIHLGLPSYEQSVLPPIEIPPPYEEAIKRDSPRPSSIPSVSWAVDQNTTTRPC